MKRIAIIASVIVAFVIIAAGALLVFPPKGPVKDWLAQQVKATTGRELVVNGDMSLRLLPRIVLRLENVELKNPPGPPRDPLFAARAVLVEAELWPLIVGRRSIDRVSVEEPRIALATNAQGQPNWTMPQTGDGQPVSVGLLTIANGALAYRDERSDDVLELAALEGTAKDITKERIADLAVKGREVRLRGAANGPSVVLKAVDVDAKGLAPEKIGALNVKAATLLYKQSDAAAAMELAGPQASAKSLSRTGPLEAAVAFDLNKERIAGDVKLQSPAQAMEGKPSPASARLTAPKGKIDVDGTLALVGGAAKMEGKASASSPSLRSLATWVGVGLPNTGTFGPASVEGNAKVDGTRIVLDNVKLALDATKTTGSLTVDFGRARPLISGTLSADAVDADSFFEPPAPPRPRVRSVPVAASPATPPVAVKEALKAYLKAQLASLDADATLEDLTASQRKTRALAVATEWSDDPIDLSALKSVDLDLSLTVAKLTVGGFEIGVPELKADLKDGTLSLDAKNLAVEGGRLTGTATVDVREAQPKLATKFRAEGVDALAAFETIGVNGLFAGKSAVDAELRASGNSLRKLVDTLTGRLKAETGKGAIVGYDFSSIWSWIFGSRQYDASRRTPFDRLEAEVALTNGIASKSTMNVTGPILGASANGTLRLPSRDLDYRARLNLASWGQPIALRIFGEWEAPSFVPDWGGFTRGLEVQANPLDLLKEADLKDPELASLAGEVLKKAGNTGALPPQAIQALEGLKSRAEGGN